jgi:uncharacterized protein
MTPLQSTLLFIAAMAAGMINSVAGGGTLVTFPSLIWAGHSAVVANATNTLAMVPGALSSGFGYRRELQGTPSRFLFLLLPSLVGALLGAILLKYTPPAAFAAIVPYLVLFATVLFMIQGQVMKRLKVNDIMESPVTRSWMIGASIYQFLVAVYGGYFGAGIGILMLAVLGLMGLKDIHQMNGLKNMFGAVINGLAAVYFIFVGLIDWPAAILMAVGAIVGGYVAAGLARRMGQKTVRRIVIVIGLAMTVSLFFKK